jgi:hypothetical protein
MTSRDVRSNIKDIHNFNMFIHVAIDGECSNENKFMSLYLFGYLYNSRGIPRESACLFHAWSTYQFTA